MKGWPILAAIAVAAVPAAASGAETTPVRYAELADLELEQLASISVTSNARREERLVDAPASIFVITAEDIRRSGVTSITEALRLAPNLQVVRGDSNQVVVSARGGLTTTANKMLVLVDGRTIYTPLFSGVFWDAQDVVLEDIERIEVVSGPGSTLWGTNAVNGLISITTKPASQTRGGLFVAGAGNQERGAVARAGATLGERTDYRLYARYWERDHRSRGNGTAAVDESERWLTGFRADWASHGSTATIQGEAYGARVDEAGGPRDLSGGHVLARWTSRGGTSDVSAQAYFDRTNRDHVGSFREVRDTVDAEVQQAFKDTGAHRLVWGGNLRASRDRTAERPSLAFVPSSRTLDTASLFAQDEWSLRRDLKATFGLRSEHNSYTGFEWLPNVRLAWTVAPEHLAWGSFARAVRSPSRIDRDVAIPGTPPYLLRPNDTFDSEVADVFELGYRGRVAPRTSLSLTAFHHRFRDLRTVEPSGAQLVFANGADGTMHGLEGWVESVVTRDWRLTAGFTLMREGVQLQEGRVNLTDPPTGNNPRKTAQVRSLWNATPDHEVDVAWRYVGALPAPAVPAYVSLDVRLGWRVSRQLDLSLAVENVLDHEHAEFAGEAVRAVFGRTWFLKATWSPW